MEKVRLEHFQGKKIIRIDFSGLKKIGPIAEIAEEASSIIRSQMPKSIYSLSNIERMFFNNKVKDLLLKHAKANSEYVIASAVIGASSMHNLMMNALNLLTGRQFKSFFDEESAKMWLVQHT